MAYGKILLVGLLLLSSISPAIAMEKIYQDWRRDQPRQRQQAAPREVRSQPVYNEPGAQELHGATSRENCNRMAERFKREGRKLKLVRVDPTTNPGATLQYICVFQGEGATTGYFDENRY